MTPYVMTPRAPDPLRSTLSTLRLPSRPRLAPPSLPAAAITEDHRWSASTPVAGLVPATNDGGGGGGGGGDVPLGNFKSLQHVARGGKTGVPVAEWVECGHQGVSFVGKDGSQQTGCGAEFRRANGGQWIGREGDGSCHVLNEARAMCTCMNARG